MFYMQKQMHKHTQTTTINKHSSEEFPFLYLKIIYNGS